MLQRAVEHALELEQRVASTARRAAAIQARTRLVMRSISLRRAREVHQKGAVFLDRVNARLKRHTPPDEGGNVDPLPSKRRT